MVSNFENYFLNKNYRLTRNFGDFEVDCLSRLDLVNLFIHDIQSDPHETRVVFDINGHALSLAKTDKDYQRSIKESDIIHADGGFIVSLSRFFKGNKIPERSATTDMIHDFAIRFEETGHSFFLLGGDEETNSECEKKLREIYPNLRIVGRHHGYFSDGDLNKIIDKINYCNPDLVWIGLGKPREQLVSLRIKEKVKAKWLVTCGGCFNFVTGAYSRAPLWMQENNLEWLHRLATNPKKLFWRYFITSPHAFIISIKSCIFNK